MRLAIHHWQERQPLGMVLSLLTLPADLLFDFVEGRMQAPTARVRPLPLLPRF